MTLLALLLALQTSPWKHVDDIDAARAEAKKSGKAVVAYFWSAGSPDCKRMDDVYAGPAISKILSDRVVAVRVSADAKPDLAKLWEVDRTPATVFFDVEGFRLTDLRGWHSAKVVERKLNRLADAMPVIAEEQLKGLELFIDGKPETPVDAKLLARYIEIGATVKAALRMYKLSLSKIPITDPATVADMMLAEAWEAKTADEAIAFLDKALAADPEDKSGHIAIVVRTRADRFMTAKDGKRLLVSVEEAMKRFPAHDEIEWFWSAKVRAFQLLEEWKKAIETADAALAAIGDSPWVRSIETMKQECRAQLKAGGDK